MRRAKLLLPIVAVFAILSVGCVGFSEPRGWAEPAFEGDSVYVFVESEQLTAITLGDAPDQVCGSIGETAWHFPDDDLEAESGIELEAVYGSPLFAGGRIILAGFSGELVALTPEGRFLASRGSWWRDDVDGAIVGGAVLAGDRFAFGTTEQRLYVRAVEDGGRAGAWPVAGIETDGEIWSRPVVVGGALYVGTMAGALYAFDLETGDALWDAPFDAGGAIADLAFIRDGAGGGVLFVPTLRGEVWLVDAASGQAPGDAFKGDDWIWTTPVVQDGVAYFGDFGGIVYALDLATGDVRWTYEAGEKVKAKGVILQGTLIVGDEGGVVHFLELATGAPSRIQKLDGAGKIRAGLVEKDGLAWVFGTEGRLYCADPQSLPVELQIGEPS